MSGLIKRGAEILTHSAAFSRFVALLEQTDGRQPNLLRVLTYHRVDEPEAHPSLYPGLISATPAAFDEQMDYLAMNCNVVSMAEVLTAFQGATLPPRSVLVTFDDAYCDFAEHAWPTMQRRRLPATVFVPTAFPDRPARAFWWDQLYHAVNSARRADDLDTPCGRLPLATPDQRASAFRRLNEYVKTLPHREAMALVEQICRELNATAAEHHVLGWDALRQLAGEGVTLGAHTQTHPLMNRISPDEVLAEAVGSRRDLEREIGTVLPILAYPSGGFNDAAVRVLEHEGFALAFTCVRGINNVRHADRLRLRRINVGRKATLAVVRAQLLARSIYLDRWRPLASA